MDIRRTMRQFQVKVIVVDPCLCDDRLRRRSLWIFANNGCTVSVFLFFFCLTLINLSLFSLLGPRCVLSCLVNNIDLPAVEWPIFSLTMQDLTVCISGLRSNEKVNARINVNSTADIYLIYLNCRRNWENWFGIWGVFMSVIPCTVPLRIWSPTLCCRRNMR